MPFCPAPAHSLSVTSRSAANRKPPQAHLCAGGQLVTALLTKVFFWPEEWFGAAGDPGTPLAPSGSSALKTSALSFLLKSSRFQGGER